MDFRKILHALDQASKPVQQNLTESTVVERSPLSDFTAWAGTKINAGAYNQALSTLRDVLERKGGAVKHDVAYYAEHVARSFKGVDGKKLAELYQRSLTEGYRIMPSIDRERYTELPGLEGPFAYANGRVLYYDPKEGKYYDRDQDMYLDHEEALAIHNGRADLMHTESTSDAPAFNAAAQEIFAALLYGVLSNSSAVLADNFVKSVVRDHGLSDSDLPGVVAQVKQMGYTGSLLDSLAETKVPGNYAAMMQKKKRKKQAAKNESMVENNDDRVLSDEVLADTARAMAAVFKKTFGVTMTIIHNHMSSGIKPVPRGWLKKLEAVLTNHADWEISFADVKHKELEAVYHPTGASVYCKVYPEGLGFVATNTWKYSAKAAAAEYAASKATTESRVTFSIAEGQRHERFDNTAVYFNNEKVGLVGRVNETSNKYAFVTTRKEFAKLEKARFESKFDAQQYVEKMLEAYANSPNPVYGDVEDMTQTLAGGINKPKSKHFKQRAGDNALAADDCGCDLKESSVAAREKDMDGKSVIVTGVQGVSSKQFRKKFKTQSAAERWIEKNEDNIDNVHIFAESRINESADSMTEREARQIVKLIKAMERPASPTMALSMKKDLAKLKSKYNMSVSELLILAKQKSVTEQAVVENERYYEGDQVVLRPEYADPDEPDAVYTLKNWDGKRGWVVDEDGRGWSVTADQIAYPEEDLDEAKQLDELSPETLRSYAAKAQADNQKRRSDAEAKGERMWSYSPNNTKPLTPTNQKFNKRDKDIRKAFKKAAAQEKPVQQKASSSFGDNRGYGQGRYMGD